jgi:dTDP-4-dehydrorhamnose 3,5-epimerase
MTLTPTRINGAVVVEAKRFADHRGDFYRSFDIEVFTERGLVTQWDYVATASNHRRHTLRGMHFQRDPHGETKLVRCIRGALLDVAIDLRPGSPSFLQWDAVELTYENQRQFYIPVGCAHGYITLTDDTDVAYCIAGRYAPSAGAGVRWNDPAFGVTWPAEPAVIIERDASYADYVRP